MGKKTKELLEELANLISSVAAPPPPLGAAYTAKIVLTNELLFEYFPLPYIDTSTRFLYRLVTPVPTIWAEGSLSYAERINGNAMEKFAQNKWEKMLETLSISDLEFFNKTMPCILNKMTVKIVECEMKPKENI